jgi:hypothetical protein
MLRYVADNYKVAPEGTDEATVTDWTRHDDQLHEFIKETIPEALQHTGMAAFDEHLKGVQAVLRNWGAEQHVSDAGLFHSIYGTQGFQGFKLSFSKRAAIRNLIGPKAERLVWIFCMADRLSVDKLVEKHYNRYCVKQSDGSEASTANTELADEPLLISSRLELGNIPIAFTDEAEWLSFVELTLADWLEQCEGAAERRNELYGWDIGEAYSYRRAAFAQMAALLPARVGDRLARARRMHEEVFATEDPATRSLHQPVTPAISPAARAAREARASVSA